MLRALFIYCIICFALFSCEIPVDPLVFNGSERFHARGRVLDGQGNPLTDITVYIRACKTDTDCEMVVMGKTDAKGQFDMLHSKTDGVAYSLHINDYVLGRPEIIPNSTYHNSSIKYKIESYQNNFKNFGDVGFLGPAAQLTIRCRVSGLDKDCHFSVSSKKMDSALDGFETEDNRYKYFKLNHGETLTLNVPQHDTLTLDYKRIESSLIFLTFTTWKKNTLILEGINKEYSF